MIDRATRRPRINLPTSEYFSHQPPNTAHCKPITPGSSQGSPSRGRGGTPAEANSDKSASDADYERSTKRKHKKEEKEEKKKRKKSKIRTSSPTLIGFPPHPGRRTRSPGFTAVGTTLPSLSGAPGPTAMTVASGSGVLVVDDGRKMPVAVF